MVFSNFYSSLQYYDYNIFKIEDINKYSLIVTRAKYAYVSELNADKALNENKNSNGNFWGKKEINSIKDLKSINISKTIRKINW